MRSQFSFDIYFIYMLMYTLFTFFVSFAPTPFWVLFFCSSFAYSTLVDCFLLREIIRINCSCLCKNKWSIPTNTYNSIKGWLRETGQFFSATAQEFQLKNCGQAVHMNRLRWYLSLCTCVHICFVLQDQRIHPHKHIKQYQRLNRDPSSNFLCHS